MPKPRKTESQRRAERFGESYRIGKARLGATEEQIGAMLGLGRPALLSRRKEPEKFSVGEIVKLGRAFGWTDEEYLAITHASPSVSR